MTASLAQAAQIVAGIRAPGARKADATSVSLEFKERPSDAWMDAPSARAFRTFGCGLLRER